MTLETISVTVLSTAVDEPKEIEGRNFRPHPTVFGEGVSSEQVYCNNNNDTDINKSGIFFYYNGEPILSEEKFRDPTPKQRSHIR